MLEKKSVQKKEWVDFGFSQPNQKRGFVKWIIAILVFGNIYQYKIHVDDNEKTFQLLHEMIDKQLDTKQKIDSTIAHTK